MPKFIFWQCFFNIYPLAFKNTFFKISNRLTQSFNLERFLPLVDFGPLILVYHLVSDEKLNHVRHLFPYHDVKNFERDIDFLATHFDFIDWDTFLEQKKAKTRSKKPSILLTFDDGYAEFYDIIVPILKRKGIYAINFINPKFIDNKDLMWRCKASVILSETIANKEKEAQLSEMLSRQTNSSILNIKYENQSQLNQIANELEIDFKDYLKNNNVYLATNQLKALQNDGFGISSHGWNHPLYNQLSLDKQLENTQKSLDYMTENNFLADSFAFPFTDHLVKNKFFEEIFQQNPLLQFTFGAAGLKQDLRLNNLQRIPMENENYNAQQILKSELLYYYFLKKSGKHVIKSD